MQSLRINESVRQASFIIAYLIIYIFSLLTVRP